MVVRPIDDIISTIEKYSEEVIRNQAHIIDEKKMFPEETLKHLIDLGALRIPFSRSSGGLEGNLQDILKVVQLVSKECASTASVLLTQITFGIQPIYNYGTIEQKNLYLPQLLTGELLGAFAVNEIESGSDLDKIVTRAVETEEGWEITGEKDFISLAGKAGIYSVAAKIELLDGEESHGIFLVPSKSVGMTIGEPKNKMGIHGLPVADIKFDRVALPKEAMLGGKPGGKEQIYAIKDYNKLFVAAQGIGLALGVFERTLIYMQQDRRFGKRLIDLPDNQNKMADAYSEIYSGETVLQSIEIFDPNNTRLSALIKLKASNLAVKTADMAMALTGGYGYTGGSSIERYSRDSQLTQIYGGSNTAQKKIISAPWLKRIQ